MKKQYICRRLKFLDIFNKNFDVVKTCEEMDINYMTFKNWLNKYNWFKEEFQFINKNKKEQIVEDKLFKKILEGDLNAIDIFLKNKK